MPLVNPSNEDQLKLEIWREIMRAKGDYYPGASTLMGGGANGNFTRPNDPVESAKKANDAFNALYSPAPKKATKKRR